MFSRYENKKAIKKLQLIRYVLRKEQKQTKRTETFDKHFAQTTENKKDRINQIDVEIKNKEDTQNDILDDLHKNDIAFVD